MARETKTKSEETVIKRYKLYIYVGILFLSPDCSQTNCKNHHHHNHHHRQRALREMFSDKKLS